MMNKYASRALPLDGGFIKVISYRSDSESNNDQWRRFLAAFVFCFFFLSGLSPRSVLAGGARPTPTDRGEKKKKGFALCSRCTAESSCLCYRRTRRCQIQAHLASLLPGVAKRTAADFTSHFNFFFFLLFFPPSFDLFLQTFLRLLQLNGKKKQKQISDRRSGCG